MKPPGLSRRLLGVCALLLMLVAGISSCSGPADDTPPDVILIMIDTLRADHLGCYGNDDGTSPNIDRFAAGSLVFENALSHAADTRFSCAALLSGYLPHETSITLRPDLPDEVPMLAETLQSNGYETAAVISNYVLRKGQGFEQGFETFDSTMQQRELTRRWPERIAERTTDRAVELLEQPRDHPLFLWVHYQDPHGPYAPPDSFVREPGAEDDGTRLPFNDSLSGRGGIPAYQRLGDHHDSQYYASRYEGEIRYTDHHFARLIQALKDTGRYDKAVIVLSADHGEGMGEHDYWFAHGEYLYQDQIHVPLILHHGKLTGRRSDFVQHVDFVPTILGMLGIPVGDSLRGIDLFKTPEGGRAIVSEMQSPLVADGFRLSIVRDGFQLIYAPETRGIELYDLAADPGEVSDLFADGAHEATIQSLMSSLAAIRSEDRLGIPLPEAPREPTAEERENLRSLGYVH